MNTSKAISKMLFTLSSLSGVRCETDDSHELLVNGSYMDSQLMAHVLSRLIDDGSIEIRVADDESDTVRYFNKLCKGILGVDT